MGAVFAACALVSCEEDIEVNLDVTPKEVVIPAEGGSGSFTLTSPVPWTAEPSEDWVKISPSSGDQVDVPVVITVSANANPSETERTAAVKLGVPGFPQSETVKVIQRGKAPEPAISVSPESGEFEAAGGEVSIAVTANTDWTAAANADWITVSPAQGNGNATVKIKATANTAVEPRTAAVEFTCGNKKATVSLTQKAAQFVYELSLSETSATVVAEGAEVNIVLYANAAWTASSSQKWISVYPEEGEEDAEILIAVSANEVEQPRTGTVVFTCGDRTATFTVSQEAAKLPKPIQGFQATIDAWAQGETISLSSSVQQEILAQEWSIYLPIEEIVIPMERGSDGLYTAHMYNYNAMPFYFVRNDMYSFGSVYTSAYVPKGDGTYPVSLIFTKSTRHAIYLKQDNDVVATLDPVALRATFEDLPNDWQSLGKGLFVDGFILPLFELPNREVEVEIQEDRNNPGQYRVVEPYKELLAGVSDFTVVDGGELIFRVIFGNKVYFKETFTGVYDSDREYYNAMSVVPENRWEAYDWYGEWDENNLSALLYDYACAHACVAGRYFLTNEGRYMSITLPGGTREKHVSIDDFWAGEFNDQFNVWGYVSVDVTELRGGYWPGELGEDQVLSTCIPELLSSDSYLVEFVPGTYVDLYYPMPKDGVYTAVLYAVGPDGKTAYAFSSVDIGPVVGAMALRRAVSKKTAPTFLNK